MRRSTRRALTLVAVTVAVLVGGGCGSDDGSGSSPVPTFDPFGPTSTNGGRRFIARSTAAIDDTPGEVMEIELTDTSITYAESCNDVTHTYVVVDSVLRFEGGSGMSTAVACSAEQDASSPRLPELLGALPTFVIEGDVLTISTPTVSVQLIDANAQSRDDLPLDGTDWHVSGVVGVPNGGGSLSMLEPASVRFDGASATVTVSCFTRQLPLVFAPGSGPSTAAATGPTGVAGEMRRRAPTSTIVVTVPPMTSSPTTEPMMPAPPTTPPPPCDPNQPSEWANDVFAAFSGELTVEIDIDRARLRRADGTGIDLIAA